jgi:zinc transport system substrate-binding protein
MSIMKLAKRFHRAGRVVPNLPLRSRAVAGPTPERVSKRRVRGSALPLFPRPLQALFFLFLAMVAQGAEPERRLRVGVTLHPYFSFVSNIVGPHADVVPLVDAGFNSHNYSPQPADLKRAATLDALVLNGVGHDAFALKIVEAAGKRDSLPMIQANEKVSLLPVAGLDDGQKAVNPHTFISISAAIQQVYAIADGLSAIAPVHAADFRRNARAYAGRLRKLKAQAMERVASLPTLDLRCASVHGSYDYLLAEFGLEVSFVVEPAPGLQPSAAQLKRTVDALRERRIHVLFAEEEFPAAYVETIREATGVNTRFLKHLTSGPYSPEHFEEGMRYNLDQLAGALLEAAAKKP